MSKPLRRARRSAPKSAAAATAACAAAIPLLLASRARAADVISTWSGANANWTSTPNWINFPATAAFPNNGNAGVATYDAIINAGTVTLDQNITIQRLTLNGGALTGAGNLTTNELFTWNGASLTGTGTLNANGGMNIGGAATHFFRTNTINNPASTVWAGGSISSGEGAIFNNSGTFTATFNGNFNFNQGAPAPTFNNSGRFQKLVATGDTNMFVRFNNTGLVHAETGAIVLSGGGAASGQFSAAAGAAVEFTSDYTLNPGASFTGAGSARLTAQTLTLAGNVSATNFDLAGGTLTGTGDFTPQQLNWTAGTMTGSGATNIPPGGSLSIAGGSTKTFTQRTISNSAIATWSGGQISSGQGATYNNRGVFVVTSNALWSSSSGTPSAVFNNFGAFTKHSSAATTTMTPVFNNIGPGGVGVNTGFLSLLGGGSASSSFTILAGAVLGFSSDYTLTNGASLGGNGTARLSANTLTIAAPVPATRFEITGGTLAGPGTLSISDSLGWSAGAIDGSARVVLGPGATATVDGATKTFSGAARITNNGVFNWTSSQINSGDTAVFRNNGTFNASAPALFTYNIGAPSSFENAGVLNKTAGTGNTTFDLEFLHFGTVNVSSGTLTLADGGAANTGSFNVTAPGTLAFTNGIFDAQANSSFTGNGTINVESGTLNVLGNYAPSGTTRVTGGTLNFNSNASTQNLAVGSGVLTGGGNLTVPGQFDWTGGTHSGTGTTFIPASATLNIAGAATKTLTARTISNSGTANWLVGQINATGGAVFRNSGTFNTLFDGTINSTGATFQNSGQFIKSGGNSNTHLDLQFINTGTVRATAGAINFLGGGSASGSFVAAANASTQFSNNYTLAQGATLSGAGTHRLTNGTLQLDANVPAVNFFQSGGTLAGPGDLYVSGKFDWTAGASTGPGVTRIEPNAALLIAEPSTKSLSRSLRNDGTINWGGGNINSGGAATLFNAGFFLTTFDGTMSFNLAGGSSHFNNAASFVKDNSVGTTTLNLPFHNSGTVTVSTGTLALIGGGSATGRFMIAANAVVESNSNYTFGPGAISGGAGVFRLAGDILTIAPPGSSAQRFEHTGGSLAGTGTLTIDQQFNWSGGNMTDAGTTLLGPAVIGNITGNATKLLRGGRTLSNQGQLTWNAGIINTGEAAIIHNSGTFIAAFDGANLLFGLSGTPSQFNNTGHFTRTGSGSGATNLSIPFNNDGIATIAAGRLDLTGGGAGAGSFDIRPNSELRATANYDFRPNSQIYGAGTFRVNNGVTSVGGTYDVATTSIDTATLNFTQSPTPNSRTLLTENLLFNNAGARLNLNNNNAAIDYPTTPGASPLAAIRAKLLSGFAGGAWNGNGIHSTSAAQRPGAGIAYAEASSLLGISGAQTALFNNQVVDATTLLMEYTLRGDTNLDQTVNFTDLVALAQNYNNNTGNATWQMGDSDYDGNVGFPDLVALAQNYGDTLPTAGHFPPSFESDLRAAFAQVPEPAALLPAALTLCALKRRRRSSPSPFRERAGMRADGPTRSHRAT